MTQKRIEHYDVPQSDRSDQSIPIDPDDTVDVFEHQEAVPPFVNDADWIDQQIVVPVDEPDPEKL